ncbi:MAG TPA: hypothetical protein VJG32_07970 [Anaerolineae bacterium]|nr:hypothetical protein [Anaerolineae bacterium]
MKLLYRKLISLAVVALLAASACSGGATPAPTPTQSIPATPTPAATDTPEPTPTSAATNTPAAVAGDACVVGTWELSDMSGYIESVMSNVEGIEFAGQDGAVRYTFAPDGQALFDAQNFAMRFEGAVSGVPLNLEISINGTGTATYEVSAAGSMTISNSDVTDMTFSATLNGAEIFSDASGELGSLFGAVDDETATLTYTCAGDTLTYTPPLENAQPITLNRVSP